MVPVLTKGYETILLIVALFAIARFKHVNNGTRYICVLLWLEALTEAIGKFTAIHYQTNIPVYNISFFTEYIIICLFFNQIIGKLKKNNIGVIIAFWGLMFGVANMLFLQPVRTINSGFNFFECLCVTCLCLYAMYLMMFDPEIHLAKETYFWICITLLFYQCTSLWNWGIYSYIVRHSADKSVLMNTSLLIVNIVTYCSFFFILFFYPKMYRTNV